MIDINELQQLLDKGNEILTGKSPVQEMLTPFLKLLDEQIELEIKSLEKEYENDNVSIREKKLFNIVKLLVKLNNYKRI